MLSYHPYTFPSLPHTSVMRPPLFLALLELASAAFIPQKRCSTDIDCYWSGGMCGTDGWCGGTGAMCVDSTSCLSIRCAKDTKTCLPRLRVEVDHLGPLEGLHMPPKEEHPRNNEKDAGGLLIQAPC